MIKGLEALKNIKREAGTPYFSTLYDIDMWREDFGIIDKELKALAIIKKACRKYPELRATIGIACVSDLNLVLEVLDND